MSENQNALAVPVPDELKLPLKASLSRALTAAKVDWTGRTVTLDKPLKPADFEGLEQAIEIMRQHLRPATREERMVALAELVIVLPQERLDDKRYEKIRWDAYHRALEALPCDVLRAACQAIIPVQIFFPKPAQILAAARTILAPRLALFSRLKAFKNFKIEVANENIKAADPQRRQELANKLRAAFAAGSEVDHVAS
jgi:hypothetical protein